MKWEAFCCSEYTPLCQKVFGVSENLDELKDALEKKKWIVRSIEYSSDEEGLIKAQCPSCVEMLFPPSDTCSDDEFYHGRSYLVYPEDSEELPPRETEVTLTCGQLRMMVGIIFRAGMNDVPRWDSLTQSHCYRTIDAVDEWFLRLIKGGKIKDSESP